MSGVFYGEEEEMEGNGGEYSRKKMDGGGKPRTREICVAAAQLFLDLKKGKFCVEKRFFFAFFRPRLLLLMVYYQVARMSFSPFVDTVAKRKRKNCLF